MKKNTLLYLDKRMVTLAKKFDLNISQITENALKSRLYPYVSAGERQLFFFGHVEELKKQGSCFFLPAGIKSLQIKKVRLFKDLKLSFSRSVNIVYGPNASGKTILIKIIASVNQLLEKTNKKKIKKVRIEFSPKSEIAIKYYGKKTDKDECILLDEPVHLLEKKHKKQFLDWLKKEYDNQVILITVDEKFSKMIGKPIILKYKMSN